MIRRPSWATLIVTGWVGFMFATAVAALVPSVRLLAAPLLCHAPYGHGVIQVHNYSYGPTSGYSLSLRCADGNHNEIGTNWLAVVGLLWLFGWVATLAIWGATYWLRVLTHKAGELISDRRERRRPVGPRPRPPVSRPGWLTDPSSASRSTATPVNPMLDDLAQSLRAGGGGTRMLINGQPFPAPADAVDQLVRLVDLRDRGVLTEQEFAAQKEKILSGG
jgi:hypothetical protein